MAKEGLWTSPMSRSEKKKGAECFQLTAVLSRILKREFFTMAFFPACVAGVF